MAGGDNMKPSMQLEFPPCVARAAAALQQVTAVVEEPNCASAELAEARRWLVAAHEAAVRSCPPTVVAYLAYRTEWFAQAAAVRILEARRHSHDLISDLPDPFTEAVDDDLPDVLDEDVGA
jgi:hypothetical protein